MSWLVFVINYFVIINIVTLVVMRIDIHRIRKEKTRIPEQAIFVLALIGGSLGAKIGEDALQYQTTERPVREMLRGVAVIQVIVFLVLIAFLLR